MPRRACPSSKASSRTCAIPLRILRKSWGFTSIAAISLALAIGANTTIFSVMKRLLLDRLDVPHAEQLRLLHWHGDKNTAVTNMWGMPDNVPEGIAAASFSYPAFEQLRRDNHVLEDLFAFKDVGRMNATIDGDAQILQGELVSGNFFDQLQVQAAARSPHPRRRRQDRRPDRRSDQSRTMATSVRIFPGSRGPHDQSQHGAGHDRGRRAAGVHGR